MNTKRKFHTGTDYRAPVYLYEIDVDVEARGKIKTYRLTKNTVISVHSRSNLPRGQYVFQYAEKVGNELLIYVDRYGWRKTIREADIKQVHRRE